MNAATKHIPSEHCSNCVNLPPPKSIIMINIVIVLGPRISTLSKASALVLV